MRIFNLTFSKNSQLFFVFLFLPSRETNLKVRQALTVTSDLGDISKLMDFDGEMMPKFLFSHFLSFLSTYI